MVKKRKRPRKYPRSKMSTPHRIFGGLKDRLPPRDQRKPMDLSERLRQRDPVEDPMGLKAMSDAIVAEVKAIEDQRVFDTINGKYVMQGGNA